MANSSQHDAQSASATFDVDLSNVIEEMRNDFTTQEIADRLLGVVRWTAIDAIQFADEPGQAIKWNPVHWQEEDAPHRIR